MKLEVTTAGLDERERLLTLFQLYVYDLSELLGLDVGEDGRFETPPLDGFFGDPRAHAFLFHVDGKLAGFGLVKQGSRLSGDLSVHDMAEFFVVRRYRHHGIGARAAAWLFDRFRGRWEVRQKTANHPATAFWRRTIGRYTKDSFEEQLLDDDRWRGLVQSFDSARP